MEDVEYTDTTLPYPNELRTLRSALVNELLLLESKNLIQYVRETNVTGEGISIALELDVNSRKPLRSRTTTLPMTDVFELSFGSPFVARSHCNGMFCINSMPHSSHNFSTVANVEPE